MDSTRDDQQRLREACGAMFEALRARWEKTTDADVAERDKIVQELRYVTRLWMECIAALDKRQRDHPTTADRI